MYMTPEKLAEYKRAQRARAKCIALYLRHRKKFREQRRAINRAIREGACIADLIDAPLDRKATRLIRKPTAEDF